MDYERSSGFFFPVRDPFVQFNIYCLSNIISVRHTPSPEYRDLLAYYFYLHAACRNAFFTTAIFPKARLIIIVERGARSQGLLLRQRVLAVVYFFNLHRIMI